LQTIEKYIDKVAEALAFICDTDRLSREEKAIFFKKVRSDG